MGGRTSTLKPKDLDELQNRTNFTEAEIRKFHNSFITNYPSGKLTKEDMVKLYQDVFPNGDATMFAENMFRAYDTDKNGFVDFREFMCGLVVLAMGKPEQKLPIIFRSYDIDNDGYITKAEFEQMAEAFHKAVQSKAHGPSNFSVTFGRLSSNHGDKVSFEEFSQIAKRDPLILALLE